MLAQGLGPTPLAHADTPSSEGAASARRAEAKAKFEAGVQAYRERRYQEAVLAFQQADGIEPSAPLSFNIARAFERLNDSSAALRWYRDYLRRSPQAKNRSEVQARVNELAATVAKRGVQQISVLSTPSGASVSIDGTGSGVTPVTLELSPGAHHVVLKLSGYADASVDFKLEPLVPQDVALELEPPKSVPANAAQVRNRDATRRDASTRRPFGVAPWVVAGAGAATLLGALGFELGRRSAESAAEKAPQLEYQSHYDSMESRKTTARVLLGVGGALVLTGGALFVLNTPRKSAPALSLGCFGEQCGIAARGSFQ